MDRPRGWRKGQMLFNFMQWLATNKGMSNNQSYRMADTFHISDKDFDKFWDEYLTELKMKSKESL